jgi:uncharacterized membrane protein
MSRKTILILALVLVPVAVMVIAAIVGWGDKFPNAHFVFAFALGATVTVLLAVGLFGLSYYSARHGHDEKVNDEQDSDGP